MTNQDTGWRPKGVGQRYGGYDVWDHDSGPHQLNPGEVDGVVDLGLDDVADDADADAEE